VFQETNKNVFDAGLEIIHGVVCPSAAIERYELEIVEGKVEVRVLVSAKGRCAMGRCHDSDPYLAAVKAYLSALWKIDKELRKRLVLV
jgi:hypothetical protein